MREGARVSSRQQLIKSYSNWFTFASLHKSAKQSYTKEISSGLFYIQTSDDRLKKNVLKCWIHGVCSRDVGLELKAATFVLLGV